MLGMEPDNIQHIFGIQPQLLQLLQEKQHSKMQKWGCGDRWMVNNILLLDIPQEDGREHLGGPSQVDSNALQNEDLLRRAWGAPLDSGRHGGVEVRRQHIANDKPRFR